MELTIDEALQQSITAHKEGKLQDAERLYRAILQVQPNHPDANHNLGVLAVAVGKPIDAVPLFESALRANSRVEQFWLSYLDVLIKLERFEDAERVLIEAEQAGVSSLKLELLRQHTPKYLRADNKKNKKGLTVSERRKKLAEKKKRKIINRNSDSSGLAPSQDRTNSLLEHYQSGRFDDAEKLAVSLVEEFPAHPFGWQVLGVLLYETGRLTESLLPMQKLLEVSPRDPHAHYNLGATLKELGRLSEAELSFNKAIVLSPDSAEAHNYLGTTLLELGRSAEAEASINQAIALDPLNAEAHYNLGLVLQDSSRLSEAEVSYIRAITLKPNFAEAHNNLGTTFRNLGRLAEAEASYKRATELMPDFAEAHHNLGVSLQEQGRLDEAHVTFTKAIALNPEFAEAHSGLGDTFQKLGRLDDAKECFRRAITLNPDAGHAAHMLSALTGASTMRAPLDYVENLFDGYAANFDASLVNQLDYRTPRVILDLIKQNNTDDNLGSVLDLGCGTGLFGIEVSELCNRLEGLDISGNMLRKAEDRGLYDRLIKQDIESYLSNETLDFDYFVATDVFVYIGELADVFESIQSRNASGGRLVFSVEHKDGNDFALLPSGRYAHSKPYIEGLCKRFQYQLEHFETQNLRLDKSSYIRGGLYLLSF